MRTDDVFQNPGMELLIAREIKVIIVKGREGEWAPVPAVPDNLFSLLHSN